MNHRETTAALVCAIAGLAGARVSAAEVERAMFGNTPSRNMVSAEKGLPTKFDPATGLNVLWVSELGSQTYGGPVVAGGKVFVGTNNQREYRKELKGDRGNVMAFDAATGKLVWQSAHAKLGAGRVNDWPLQGVCSTPFVEGDRIWYVSNRAEVICADTEGFRDGENDGPYTEEGETTQTPEGPKRLPLVGEIDEDVVWKFDMIGELDVFPHNLAAGSPLIVGDVLYAVTGQGVDEGHANIPAPAAPSFIALNKKTGDLVWESALPGERIFHGTWSNAAGGVIAGRAQIVFGGGDGWVYSLDPKTGELLWKFNANPPGARYILGGAGTANEIISTPVIHGDRVYVGVGQDPEHGEAPGHLWAIDATKSGDVTATAKVWHVGDESFNRTISTVSIHDGLLYVADLSGFVYCLELATGQLHWKYDSMAAIWGSTFVADGKVYIGDEDGDIAVLRAGKTKELLHEVNMGAAVYTTPVAKGGVIFVASRTRLFALREGIPAKPPAAAKTPPPPG